MIGNGRKPVSVARKNRKLIWKEIRELKTFTSKDIEQRTKVLSGTIFSYLKALEKAGILHTELQNGKGGLRRNIYTLIKDTGAMAPVVSIRYQKRQADGSYKTVPLDIAADFDELSPEKD